MPVPYTSQAIANSFVDRFGSGDVGMNHLKLQKLVYCSYGWWLALKGLNGPRLTSDKAEVWRYGPVFNDLYHVLKIYGNQRIRNTKSLTPFSDSPLPEQNDQECNSFIHWIWDRYGHLSSSTLSSMTHKKGTPWQRVAEENDYRVPSNCEIPDEYIFEEFSNLLKNMGGGEHVAR